MEAFLKGTKYIKLQDQAHNTILLLSFKSSLDLDKKLGKQVICQQNNRFEKRQEQL